MTEEIGVKGGGMTREIDIKLGKNWNQKRQLTENNVSK